MVLNDFLSLEKFFSLVQLPSGIFTRYEIVAGSYLCNVRGRLRRCPRFIFRKGIFRYDLVNFTRPQFGF